MTIMESTRAQRKGARLVKQNKYANTTYDEKDALSDIPKVELMRFRFNARFARCLVQRREELKLTQEALAERSGVNRVTIAKIESFQRLASTEIILKLLDALNMDIQFIERN